MNSTFFKNFAPNLICLALGGSVGMTLVILACALPQFNLWWPLFVIAFYVLAAIPSLISRNNESRQCAELAVFLTVGIVISAFALPIVLARTQAIQWGACYLTLSGNFVVFATIFALFVMMDQDGDSYASGF